MRIYEDLKNKRYGRLTVIKRVEGQKRGDRIRGQWLCVCDCGTSCTVLTQLLQSGKKLSCGCLKREKEPFNYINELNNKYGLLTVIKELEPKHGVSRWLCKCECGIERVCTGKKLRSGLALSCGCQRFENKSSSIIGDQQWIKFQFNTYKYSAKKRNLDFTLTAEDFRNIVLQECIYCKQIPSGGVDRFDNDKGYTLENSKPCCNWCNRMKLNKPFSDFIKQCSLIAENHKITPTVN